MPAENHFNAAFHEVTIYNEKGEPLKCTRLNAIDLIRTAGYAWNAKTETAIPEEVVEKASKPADEPVKEKPEPTDTPEKDAEVGQIDHNTAPLTEIAKALTDSDDVAKYLEGFTENALRTMAADRYEEKVHHKAKKETVIDKIMELEEEKIASEMDA